MCALKAIDLFSGCGGLTCGLKKAGFEVLAAVEKWEPARRVFGENHGEVYLVADDILNVDPYALMKTLGLEVGDLDLIAGCPPCQGFSTTRTLNGGRKIKDDRNNLVFEIVRFAVAFQPKAILLENVPGLGTTKQIAFVEAELASIGYEVTKGVLDAADYAVPQRRRRFILTAGYGGSISLAKKARVRKTVRDAIGELKPAGKSGDAIHDIAERRSDSVMQRIAAIPKDGGSRTDLSDEFQLPCHRRCDGFKDIYGRMAWDHVAPTLTTGCFNPSKGRFLHPTQNRAITVREAALLQTFPRSYRFLPQLGKIVLAEMIGNALPPEFIRRQALEIRRYLEKSETLDVD